MKHPMRMPVRRKMPNLPQRSGDVDNPGRMPMGATGGMAASPATNPDMREQETGMVGKAMVPPRLGSLKHLRMMMQSHAKRY